MSGKLTPFEVANIIFEKKEVPDDIAANYNVYMVNRVMSNIYDCALFANEINRFPDLPKLLQFEFYYYGLDKKKRFGKWNKKLNEDKFTTAIMEVFGYSREKAEQVRPLLATHEKEIMSEIEKGGRKAK